MVQVVGTTSSVRSARTAPMRTRSPATARSEQHARHSSPRKRTYPLGRQSETTRAFAPIIASLPMRIGRRREYRTQKAFSTNSYTTATATTAIPHGDGSTNTAAMIAPIRTTNSKRTPSKPASSSLRAASFGGGSDRRAEVTAGRCSRQLHAPWGQCLTGRAGFKPWRVSVSMSSSEHVSGSRAQSSGTVAHLQGSSGSSLARNRCAT